MQIYQWNSLTEKQQQTLLQRPALKEGAELLQKVQGIIKQVREERDQALLRFTEQYDKVKLTALQVTQAELKDANKQVSSAARAAMEFAISQLIRNHQSQIPHPQVVETCAGITCERITRPIERVGLYIPGGSAPLISTVMMLAIPAKIANCTKRILCTPPSEDGSINPNLLVAAQLCGIQNIYKVGGAQAIAAMAYGTETVPKVDKLFGPGNAWVTAAKMLVAQDPQGACIDMPAGPSEVMVIADDEANPSYVAADLLSQAEHGADSQVMLIAFSMTFASEVKNELTQQLATLPRKSIAEKSLESSRIIVVDSPVTAVKISNAYAPEHLILQLSDPDSLLPFLNNAGAIFMGKWAPETVGDYVTGSNHVLPTYGYAKCYSGLSVNDFMKYISVQRVTEQGLLSIGTHAEILADLEGLHAHQRAVSLRLMEVIKE